MRSDRELLQAALDALELRGINCPSLMEEIRARLAEPEDEPVGWHYRYICPGKGPSIRMFCDDEAKRIFESKRNYEVVPLYRHPPRLDGLDKLIEQIRYLEQQIAERKNQ